jgi:hypothetical protein
MTLEEFCKQRATEIVLASYIKDYLESNWGGGNLHIVLDDLNFERENIEFCYKEALDNDDVPGALICEKLLEMEDPDAFLKKLHREGIL